MLLADMAKILMDILPLGIFASGPRKETAALPVPPPCVTPLAPGSLQEALEEGHLSRVADLLAAIGRGLGPTYAAQDPDSKTWRLKFRPASDLVTNWRRLRRTAEEHYPSKSPPTLPDGVSGVDCDVEITQSEHNLLTTLVWADGRVSLDVAGANFSTYDPKRLTTELYWDAITVGALLGREHPRSVLVLGLGCGTILRQLRTIFRNTHLVGVEVDPEVLRVAREHCDLDAMGIEVVEGDARDYLRTATRKTFDVIVDDLFVSGDEAAQPVRFPLDLARARLHHGGLLVVNCADAQWESETMEYLCNTFAHVKVLRPPLGSNAVLVASDAPLRRVLPPWFGENFSEHDRNALLDVRVD